MVAPAWGRQTVREACQELGYTREDAEAYIKEAEHQEGNAYWDYFETEDDIKQDVHVYLDNLIDPWAPEFKPN